MSERPQDEIDKQFTKMAEHSSLADLADKTEGEAVLEMIKGIEDITNPIERTKETMLVSGHYPDRVNRDCLLLLGGAEPDNLTAQNITPEFAQIYTKIYEKTRKEEIRRKYEN